MKKINVLIPDGEQGNIRQLLISLSLTKSYNIYLLSNKKHNYMRFSKNCKKHFFTEDPGYSNKRLKTILSILDKTNIDIIFPTSVPAYKLIFRNLEVLKSKTNLILLSEWKDYEITVKKNLFAEFCTKNNFSVPKTISVDSLKIIQQLKDLNFPVLLKPSQGRSGVGIIRFNNIRKCTNYIEKNFADIENKYIVQEYIDTEEIDVNVLCENGKILAYTIQKGIIPPDRDFSFSKGIKLIKKKNIYNYVKPLFQKLKWNGVAHVDLLYKKQSKKIYILEINPRIWGTVLGSLKGGINFPDLLVKKSLDTNYSDFPKAYSEVRYAAIGRESIKKIFSRSSKLTFSDTNLLWLIKDPLPSIMAKFYS